MHARRGVSLLEVTVAAVLLAALTTSTVQILGWTAAQRRATQQREVALQEAANLTERLTTLPWNEMTSEHLGHLALSREAQQALSNGRLQVSVSETADAPLGKRLTVEVHWLNRAGDEEAPVRLMSWVYRREGNDQP